MAAMGGTPESNNELGTVVGFLAATGIVVAATLGGILTGPVAIAVVAGLTVPGALVGFGLGKLVPQVGPNVPVRSAESVDGLPRLMGNVKTRTPARS